MELQENSDNNQTFNATSIAYRRIYIYLCFVLWYGVFKCRQILGHSSSLRYQELVTHKRVIAVVILIWVLSAIISSMFDYWNKLFQFGQVIP